MNKLKKIIAQINQEHFQEFEESLIGSNSVKFHVLLKEYKKGTLSDEEIKETLQCTDNSFYVLKSRLYDKIQKFILSNNQILTNSNVGIPRIDYSNYLYEMPNETAIAMFQELESKFIATDSPHDLIHVYSSLKKAHFYSEKYYTYSQLYNNQVAYALALEKAEEILFNFNRTLSSYFFSDEINDVELMKVLTKEIKNIHSLYKSSRIELILNIILIESTLFASIDNDDSAPIDDLLSESAQIILKHQDDLTINHYKSVIDFLNFEYYFSLNQLKKASNYFNELEVVFQKWLLKNNVCLAYKLLLSKTEYLLKMDQSQLISKGFDDMHFDSKDIYTDIIYKFYKGISLFYSGKSKKSITHLNDLLNEISFKNYFYIESEIKLSLSFFYILQDDFEIAQNILKGLTRKLATFKVKEYKNIKAAIKLLTILINDISDKAVLMKFKEALELFEFYNLKDKKVLGYLKPEFDKMALRNARK